MCSFERCSGHNDAQPISGPARPRFHSERRGAGDCYTVAEATRTLQITLEENRRLAAAGDLTLTARRRFLGRHFPREVERAARYEHPFPSPCATSIISERSTRRAGDSVLNQFGPRLLGSLRPGIDWVARIGGEEFGIVLPETAYDRESGGVHIQTLICSS